MMIYQSIDEENQARQGVRYRAVIGAILVGFIIVTRRAITKIGYKLTMIRSQFFPTLKGIVIGISIIFIIVLIGIFLINIWAKSKERTPLQ